MSNPNDEKRKEKWLVMNFVPEDTTENEIRDLLQGWILDISIVSVNLFIPKSPWKNGTCTWKAFIELSNDESVEAVKEHHKKHTEELGTRGYNYENAKGIASEISIDYCWDRQKERYSRPASKAQATNKKQSKENSSGLNDKIEYEIRGINAERKKFLRSIQKLESELKEKCPEDFISVFELNQMRKENFEMSEKLREQKEQLESAKASLREVRSNMDQLNSFPSEISDLSAGISAVKLN